MLARLFEEFKSRIQKFQRNVKEHSLQCLVSSSVAEEGESRLNEVINFVGGVLRELVIAFKARSVTAQVSIDRLELRRSDALFFEQFFMDKFRQITRTGRRDGLIRRLREVEVAIIQLFEERMLGRESILLGELMREITTEVIRVSHDLKSRYRQILSDYEYIEIAPDPALLEKAKKLGLASPGDADHIASAATYAHQEGVRVVFVSLDYKDIVSRSHEIRRELNVHCSDPLYAIYHCT
ncbi:hypothetical protein DRN94_001870 [archaeon]|nr:hypothetical protein [archaeon]